jgi:hypothetical protein
LLFDSFRRASRKPSVHSGVEREGFPIAKIQFSDPFKELPHRFGYAMQDEDSMSDELIDRETAEEVARLFGDFPQLSNELTPIYDAFLDPIVTEWFLHLISEEQMLKDILSCACVGHSIFCVRVWNPRTSRPLPFLFCWKKRPDFYLFIELQSMPVWAPTWDDYSLKSRLADFFIEATEELNRMLSAQGGRR